MTSILFLIETIYCNIFRCNYVRNKKLSLNFFLNFPNLNSILNIFKKRMTLIADVFLNLRTPKNVVRYMSKKSLSDDPSTSNMVNGPKHCWNLNDSTFTIFIDRCEENHALKIFCDWYWKSSDCLLTHWLPMTSILFLTEAIYCNIFRWIYLRKEKHFLNLFLHFLNLEAFLNISKGKITLIADVFLKLRTPKYDVREMSKKFRFRRPFDKWHSKRAKTLLKSERQHLYHIYWSLWRQFSWKNSLLVICKTLGLFANPLTADDKYSLLNRDNL